MSPGPPLGALPWALLQEADENHLVLGPLVFEVVDSRFGRFCVSSVGKTSSLEKPRVSHWRKKYIYVHEKQ